MSIISAVNRLLPPPTYMTMPSVGVDISDTSMKYVQFSYDAWHGRNLNLSKWGDISIPEGTLSRGNVKDGKALENALREIKNVTKTDHIRVSLPEERAFLFETEIKQGTPFKEIRGLLEFRLEENVPLSPRDAFFDYDIVTTPTKSETMRVSVTVYSREAILGYFEAARSAGLLPLSFEIEAQAIARAALPRNSQGTHMITVDFGKTRTGAGSVHQGSPMYTSTIDIGGIELTNALRRQLGEISEEQATEIKNNQGLVRAAADSDAYDALITTMSAIKDELATRIQYWQTHSGKTGERHIESIVLCGGSVNLKGLTGYFSETLGTEAKRAEVWQNAFSIESYIPPIDRRHSYGYATAIGLALGSFV